MAANRLTRAEQVERNRGQVLDAARRVFLRRGFAGASLEAIADEAGFSKGVVYSQFAGKSDLFLALLEARITERAEENEVVAATAAGLAGLHALLGVNARHTEESGDWSRLLIEFRVVATRSPEVNRRYRELHERALTRFAETVRDVLARGGLASVQPPRTFAELIFALDAGWVLEQASGTSELSREVLVELITRSVVPLAGRP